MKHASSPRAKTFTRRCSRIAAVALGGVLICGSPLHAQYGELPIRPNLSAEPYFATEQGREKKRGADALVNRYRLYDFYRRQADYFLSNPGDSREILPPYPELDGGRRGHWGATNEKETTALRRKATTAFPSVISRRNDGEFYLRADSEHAPAGLVVVDSLAPGFRRAYAEAALSVPEHPFEQGADRFGFDLKVIGTPLFEGGKFDWSDGGKPIAWFAGYHVHGTQTVVEWELGSSKALELSTMYASPPDRKLAALVRRFEFPAGLQAPLEFALPLRVGREPKPTSVEIQVQGAGAITIRLSDAKGVTLHRVELSAGSVAEALPDGMQLRLSPAPAGGQLTIYSWAGSAEQSPEAAAWLRTLRPAQDTQKLAALCVGGPPRFAKPLVTAGKLNADPEASGTAYEIDDVTLPFDHPDNLPLTFSGLDFAADGTAYACTLVGDVWQITGLNGDLRTVSWKRFAAGLNLPMGLVVVDGIPYVNTVPHLIRLVDTNKDGEADFYQRYSRMPLRGTEQSGRDLRRDDAGNFYFNTPSEVLCLSADGSRLDRIGRGSRNPLGLGVRGDGLVISDSSEGNLENGTCTLYESDHPENASSIAKGKRILYLPRGVDNSPGSRLFLNEPRFGPLGRSIVGVSYGTGTWYGVLRDVAEGTPQAALIPQRGQFLSGACRLAVQPLDGQVFVAGLDGWGDYAVAEGCLHRIRYTGRAENRVTAWQAHLNGIRLCFESSLDAASISPSAFFLQQWNYVDSPKTYGSPEYSVRHPDMLGHDRLRVSKATLLADQKSLFLEVPGLLPAMCTQVRAHLRDTSGQTIDLDLYATLQQLRPDAPEGAQTLGDTAIALVVPRVEDNGNTYQRIIEHFDRLAGRDSAKRPITPEVTYHREELNFAWVQKNILLQYCITCHGAGTQHDYSTYAGVRAKLRLDAPAKSVMYGMVQTGGMPPYPLPALSKSLQDALLDWVKAGAPDR